MNDWKTGCLVDATRNCIYAAVSGHRRYDPRQGYLSYSTTVRDIEAVIRFPKDNSFRQLKPSRCSGRIDISRDIAPGKRGDCSGRRNLSDAVVLAVDHKDVAGGSLNSTSRGILELRQKGYRGIQVSRNSRGSGIRRHNTQGRDLANTTTKPIRYVEISSAVVVHRTNATKLGSRTHSVCKSSHNVPRKKANAGSGRHGHNPRLASNIKRSRIAVVTNGVWPWNIGTCSGSSQERSGAPRSGKDTRRGSSGELNDLIGARIRIIDIRS